MIRTEPLDLAQWAEYVELRDRLRSQPRRNHMLRNGVLLVWSWIGLVYAIYHGLVWVVR